MSKEDQTSLVSIRKRLFEPADASQQETDITRSTTEPDSPKHHSKKQLMSDNTSRTNVATSASYKKEYSTKKDN